MVKLIYSYLDRNMIAKPKIAKLAKSNNSHQFINLEKISSLLEESQGEWIIENDKIEKYENL